MIDSGWIFALQKVHKFDPQHPHHIWSSKTIGVILESVESGVTYKRSWVSPISQKKLNNICCFCGWSQLTKSRNIKVARVGHW